MGKDINTQEKQDTTVVSIETAQNGQAPVVPGETPPPDVKGKDITILGMKIHVEKAEKKPKKAKDPEKKHNKKKIIATVGGGLLVAGALAKGAVTFMANRADRQNSCGTDTYYDLTGETQEESGSCESETQEEPQSAEVDQAES